MSNRTDFVEQARELLEYLDQATDLGGPDDARADRLADELRNAFVAGQEAEAVATVEASLPRHNASLHITHNQHKAYYMSVDEYLDDSKVTSDQISEDERRAAVAANELWEIQWYPDTPVGSYTVYASTLEEALRRAGGGT